MRNLITTLTAVRHDDVIDQNAASSDAIQQRCTSPPHIMIVALSMKVTAC